MEIIACLVVGKPLNIFAVAVLFVVAYVIQRRAGWGAGRHPKSFLAAAAWALYAAWESLVSYFTPEANIRVDLMVIWPPLLLISIWFSMRAFR